MKTDFIQKLRQSLYVDNIATSDEDEDDDATHWFYLNIKMTLVEGTFSVQNFLSNSKALVDKSVRWEIASYSPHRKWRIK